MRRAVNLFLAVLSILLALTPRAAAAAPSVPDPDAPGLSSSERLDALFERVRVEQKAVHSLEARFVQRKESELLIEPEVSKGSFSYLAPDRVRWEFVSPNPMTVVIDDQRMTTWYRDLKRADVLAVGRYSEQILQYLGASGTLETLLDYFRVRATFPRDPAEPYRLSLDPRYPRIAKRIESMDVWIDRQRFVPVGLRYVEPDGDVTEYRFTEIEVNADIPPERFELEIPADVKRRRVAADRSSE